MVDIPTLFTGNASELDTHGTGWIIGFSDWTRLPGSDLLHVPKDAPLNGLMVKWFDHAPGHASGSKALSTGRTISLLAGPESHFELDFSLDPDFPPAATRVVPFRRTGDFAAWGAGIHHRWRALQQATILTVRWNAE